MIDPFRGLCPLDSLFFFFFLISRTFFRENTFLKHLLLLHYKKTSSITSAFLNCEVQVSIDFRKLAKMIKGNRGYFNYLYSRLLYTINRGNLSMLDH